MSGGWQGGRFYRDLTRRSSPSGKSSFERTASGLSRFPYLGAGPEWAGSGRARPWAVLGNPGDPAPSQRTRSPLPSDQVEVVAQRRVVAAQLLRRGVFAGSLRLGGVGVDQRPQAGEQGQQHCGHGGPRPAHRHHLRGQGSWVIPSLDTRRREAEAAVGPTLPGLGRATAGPRLSHRLSVFSGPAPSLPRFPCPRGISSAGLPNPHSYCPER